MAEKDLYTPILSDALIYENDKNSDIQRRIRVSSYFDLAKKFITTEDLDINRAEYLQELGFSGIDALHITLAEKANADFFITCDDNITSLYKKNKNLIRINILDLKEFVGRGVI